MFGFARKLKNLIIQLIDWFHKPFCKLVSIETFRYGATGGMNTIFDIFLYFVFYNFILQKQDFIYGTIVISPHIAAFLFVFPITFLTGFVFAKYITFTQSLLRGRVQLFRYGLSVAGSILLNYILLKFFVEVVGLWATISKIITTCFVIVYSYVLQKHFTFRTGKKTLAREMQKRGICP